MGGAGFGAQSILQRISHADAQCARQVWRVGGAGGRGRGRHECKAFHSTSVTLTLQRARQMRLQGRARAALSPATSHPRVHYHPAHPLTPFETNP